MNHILVVDDIAHNRRLLRDFLGGLGYVVDEAECKEQAVRMAGLKQYSLVLMDINIPADMNSSAGYDVGIEACREILLLPHKPPIVAVTAAGMEDEKAAILDVGVREIVQKAQSGFLKRIQLVLTKFVPSPGAIQRPKIARQVPASVSLEKVTASSFRVLTQNIQAQNLQGASESTPTTAVIDPPQNDEITEVILPTSLTTGGSRERANGGGRDREPAKIELAQGLKDKIAKNLMLPSAFVDAPPEFDEARMQLSQAHLASLELAAAVRDLEDCRPYTEDVDSLVNEFSSSKNLLDGNGVRPARQESLGHWICNMLLTANILADNLCEVTSLVNQPTPNQALSKIRRHLDAVFAITRGLSKPLIEAPFELSGKQALGPAEAQEDLLSTVGSATPSRLVLIVDDQHAARRDLEGKLKKLHYRVVSCESSVTALELLELQRFDVCLLDLDMPEISGLEMIERIRKSLIARNTSIIVVSGSGHMKDAARAIEKGADDYLSKPADEYLLRARISSCLRQSDARLAELSKFLPSHILQRVMSNQDLLEKPSPADVTVIDCDIRGFSRISERIGPVQTINWISDVMNELSQIILQHGGTIIDYVGDEIMAMWGAPIASPQHATEACKCALAIQVAAARLSEKWRSVINSDLKIGVGINSGLAVVGNTGSKHRIKYGPLGDTVNIASRVQGSTKYLQSSILITHNTASRIDECLRGRRICSVRVQNISEPVQLFELSDGDSKEALGQRREYEKALEAFESAELGEALRILAALLCQCPNDGPAKLLMFRVIQTQLGGAFDPTWTLPGK